MFPMASPDTTFSGATVFGGGARSVVLMTTLHFVYNCSETECVKPHFVGYNMHSARVRGCSGFICPLSTIVDKVAQ